MSTYWGIFCKTHNVGCCPFRNLPDVAHEVYLLWPHIKAIRNAQSGAFNVEISFGDDDDILAFMDKHENCELQLANEYGQIQENLTPDQRGEDMPKDQIEAALQLLLGGVMNVRTELLVMKKMLEESQKQQLELHNELHAVRRLLAETIIKRVNDDF